MTSQKKPRSKKDKELPAFDVDFRSRFGIDISPDVANIFRCKVCKGYLCPLRTEMWSCAQMLCGKLVPRTELVRRLIEVRSDLRQYSLDNLLYAVEIGMRE